MKLIACIDDNGGMLFNKRRQSSDICVTNSILSMLGTRNLRINAYTSTLFPHDERIIIDEDCLRNCGDDFCFVEDMDVSAYVPLAEQIILYRWNRKYPSELYFPMELLDKGWILSSSNDFVGKSHSRITMEIYKR